MSTMTEESTCPACNGKSNKTHACQVPVKKRKMTLAEVKKLAYFCINCGRVAETKEELCHPVALDEKDKQKFVSKAIASSSAETCAQCGQPVSPPGHICDPKGLPFKCAYCGEMVTNYRHMCKALIEKAQFTCKNCGRVAVEKDHLCAPLKLK